MTSSEKSGVYAGHSGQLDSRHGAGHTAAHRPAELFERGLPFNPGNATHIPNQIDPDGNRLSSFFSGTATWQHAVSNDTTYRIAYQGMSIPAGAIATGLWARATSIRRC